MHKDGGQRPRVGRSRGMVDQTRRDALDQDLRGLPPAPGLWGLAVTLALIGGTSGLAKLAMTLVPLPEAALPMVFLVAVLLASVDRKSTRLNSSHSQISHSAFFLPKL